jgi:hypothetical protein
MRRVLAFEALTQCVQGIDPLGQSSKRIKASAISLSLTSKLLFNRILLQTTTKSLSQVTTMLFKLSSVITTALAAASLVTASAVNLERRDTPASCTFVVSPSGTPDPSAELFSEWNYSTLLRSSTYIPLFATNLFSSVLGRNLANFVPNGSIIRVCQSAPEASGHCLYSILTFRSYHNRTETAVSPVLMALACTLSPRLSLPTR